MTIASIHDHDNVMRRIEKQSELIFIATRNRDTEAARCITHELLEWGMLVIYEGVDRSREVARAVLEAINKT